MMELKRCADCRAWMWSIDQSEFFDPNIVERLKYCKSCLDRKNIGHKLSEADDENRELPDHTETPEERNLREYMENRRRFAPN